MSTNEEDDIGPCGCCANPGCIKDQFGNVTCLACAVVELATNKVVCTPENPHCPKRRREAQEAR